jgi:hypothetical protein
VIPVASALDRWNVNTRRAPDLQNGLDVMLHTLPNTQHVAMWPDKDGTWLVVAKFEIKPN